MKRILATLTALAFVSASLSTAFAQGQNDNQIVPGKRIGRVYLGMSAGELYRSMGEPQKSMTYNDGHFSYNWNDLYVEADRGGSVNVVSATGPTYTLPGGVAVGSSILALQANRPTPTSTYLETPPDSTNNCYSDGLGVRTASAHVTSITVWSPGCPTSGHYHCFVYRGNVAYIGPCKRDGSPF